MIRTIPEKQLVLLGGDIILIIASFYLSPLLRFGVCPDLAVFLEWPDLSAILTYLLFFYIFDLYNVDDRFQSAGYFFRVLLALIIADLFIASLFYVFNVRPYATFILLLNTLLILSLCLGWRFIFYRWRKQYQRVLRVLIIGAGRAGNDLYKLLENRADFGVVGFLDDDQSKWGKRIGDRQIIRGTERLSTVIKERSVDLIVIAITHGLNQDLYKRVMDAKVKGLSVYEMPTFCELVLRKIPVEHVSDLWFVYMPISGVRKTTYNKEDKEDFGYHFLDGYLDGFEPAHAVDGSGDQTGFAGACFLHSETYRLAGSAFQLGKVSFHEGWPGQPSTVCWA
jgi:FlaA1/EpsC-like NDP-sugar epimerase